MRSKAAPPHSNDEELSVEGADGSLKSRALAASGFGVDRTRRRAAGIAVTVTHHAHGLRTPIHAHPWGCVHYVLEGIYREAVHGEEHVLGSGEVLFKPPEQSHWNRLGEQASWSLRLELSVDHLERQQGLPARVVTFRHPAIGLIAERLAFALHVSDPFAVDDRESLALEMIRLLAKQRLADNDRRSKLLARRCIELLEARDWEPLGLTEAAHQLGVHRSHLARVFRAETGSTLGEFQRARRLRWTLERLRCGDPRGLSELALVAGYADQSHLTRSVGRAVGLPPASLRERWR